MAQEDLENTKTKGKEPNSRDVRAAKAFNEAFYVANTHYLGPQMYQFIKDFPPVRVPVEDDIKIQGLKNPLYLVVIGFSQRKMIDSALKMNKKISNVLVIEPDIGVFHNTIKTEFVGDLLDNPIFDFLVGIPLEEIGIHLHKIFVNTKDPKGPRPGRCMQPEIICDPFRFTNQEAEPYIKAVQGATQQIFLSMGCPPDSFNRWEQSLRNEHNVKYALSATDLEGKFKDIPAFIVGGGPSVEGFIEECKRSNLHEKGCIIAVDAVLRRLLKEGIRPHMVIRCERKITTIFDGITKDMTKGIIYAAYPWTPPEYFDLFDEKVMLYRDNGICKWLQINHIGVNGGVSSANAAIELAYMMGCNKIILSGIDLCFIGGKSHVSGTDVEFDVTKSEKKWTKVKTNEDKEETTIPIWVRCLREYQSSITKYKEKNKDIQILNTSQKGAKIVGTEYRPFSEIVYGDKVFSLEEIRKLLKKPTEQEIKDFDERKTKTISVLENMAKDLKKLFLNMDDLMNQSMREEFRVAHQLRSEILPHDFFRQVTATSKSLVGIYKEPCRQADLFKTKYYTEKLFTWIILDTCQSDFFQTENRLNALDNLIPVEHERLKTYAICHLVLYRLFEVYIHRFIELFTMKKIEGLTFHPELEKTIASRIDNWVEHFFKKSQEPAVWTPGDLSKFVKPEYDKKKHPNLIL